MEKRYAIYFVPWQESELYCFGASVLGVDCYTGDAVAFPPGTRDDWAAVVREPRVYGFHATLKAPFRLAPGASESELATAVDAFARTRSPVDAGMLQVAEIAAFIALKPSAQSRALDDLAAACVREFDRFRAPMTAAERERRLRTPLTPQQVHQMDAFGYPFVFDDFRFHMTLTGPLPEPDRAAALQWLRGRFADRLSAQRLVVDRLVIACQNGGDFRVIHTAAMKAAEAAPERF